LPDPRYVSSRLLLGIVLLTSLNMAGQQSQAQRQAEAELLSLHTEERRAHFDHDVQALLAHVAPEVMDVRDGRVNHMSREDVRARFRAYFKRAEFSAWDDIDPPIVRVSSDGKMGWMIVRVRIAYTETDASGGKTKQDSVGAWMSAYEKLNGNWIMTAVTSTFGGN